MNSGKLIQFGSLIYGSFGVQSYFHEMKPNFVHCLIKLVFEIRCRNMSKISIENPLNV